MTGQTPIIEISDLSTRFGKTWVHRDLNLTVYRGEILGIVGGSGSGKTTLLRAILALQRPYSGVIKVFDQDIVRISPQKLLEVQKRWGVLFQENALFSSLTLLDNIVFPLKEHTALQQQSMEQLSLLKINMAGLPPQTAYLYPAELSGGMLRRAGLARAIVLDPELIFLDEPTAGLDPNTASAFDELILNLQKTMGLTVVMITHDLDTLWRVTDRVAFLGKGQVICVDTMANMVRNPDPIVQDFFNGPRGRAAQENNQHNEKT